MATGISANRVCTKSGGDSIRLGVSSTTECKPERGVLLALPRQCDSGADEAEGHQRQVRDRQPHDPVLDLCATDSADTAGRLCHLQPRVVASNRRAQPHQREHRPRDGRASLDGSDTQYDHKRIQQDALVPAEPAGNQSEPEREQQAPDGGSYRDQRRYTEQPSRIEVRCLHARRAVANPKKRSVGRRGLASVLSLASGEGQAVVVEGVFK